MSSAAEEEAETQTETKTDGSMICMIELFVHLYALCGRMDVNYHGSSWPLLQIATRLKISLPSSPPLSSFQCEFYWLYRLKERITKTVALV